MEVQLRHGPFVASSTALNDAKRELARATRELAKESIVTALVRAKDVVKSARAAELLVQLPGVGPVLADAMAKFFDTYADERVSANRQARQSVEQFRSTLANLARTDSVSQVQPLLVVKAHELDRCKPSYSVESLEVAKHLFLVDVLAFVLAVNCAESLSVGARHGTTGHRTRAHERMGALKFSIPDRWLAGSFAHPLGK